jgi:hypothetical protein
MAMPTLVNRPKNICTNTCFEVMIKSSWGKTVKDNVLTWIFCYHIHNQLHDLWFGQLAWNCEENVWCPSPIGRRQARCRISRSKRHDCFLVDYARPASDAADERPPPPPPPQLRPPGWSHERTQHEGVRIVIVHSHCPIHHNSQPHQSC